MINQRNDLWLNFLVYLILVFFIGNTNAQSVLKISNNVFSAGIPSEEFEYYAAPSETGRQRHENWCWAACIQMVLNYHGLNVHQEEIVTRVFGSPKDLPGNPQQVLNALSGWAPNNFGGYSTIYSQYGIYSSADIINNLAAKWPIIVGLRTNPSLQQAHAYVLTAVFYSINQFQEPIIEHVVLRDPFPGNPSRQVVPWHEFKRRFPIFFKVWVQ